jgi:ATP-binding cassette, subfamily F, member 3
MSLIELSHVTKYFGAALVLDDVSLRLDRSDHAALVGANGAGKSTMLRIMAGLEPPDAGSVHTARGLTIGYLEQEPTFSPSVTLFETMLDVFRDTIRAQQRLREIEKTLANGARNEEALSEYSRLQLLIEHTGYDYRERIERVLIGLDLPVDLWQAPISTLSGGQRTRANLARTLLQDADLLLLDEPTNHLDIPAVEWLEAYLRDLKRAFLIVSHDRYVLDRVSTRTVELSFHHITAYDAPYSRYLQLKAERQERQQLEFQAQQEEIARTEEFIRKYGAGQRYKEARGRQKRLNRLERIERPRDEQAVTLRLGRAGRSGEIVLDLRNLIVGYPDHPLVSLPDEVVVRRGEHIAIIGPNGSGKTTLVRTLVNELPPLRGDVRWGSRVTTGYYSQTLGALDDKRTVLDELRSTRPMAEEEARNYLGGFLFSGDDVFKRVEMLSGGEKSRIALAKLILQAPNVLILDEPTNHLDIASRDALEIVLAQFDGTLLFVSHDRYLIDQLAGQLWVIVDGRMRQFVGGYSGYAAGTAQPVRFEPESVAPQTTDGHTPHERVERLETEASALSTRLAAIATAGSIAQIAELSAQYETLIERIDEADYQWLETVRKNLRTFSV